MATADSQARWRDKNQFTKKQLNVMARKAVHGELEDLAAMHGLKGKAEAVTFAVILVKALNQAAEHNEEARRLVNLFTTAYHRDRDLYAP